MDSDLRDDRISQTHSAMEAKFCADTEFAEAIGVSRRTIYRLAAKGLPIVKIGKRRWVDREIAFRWLAENCALATRTAA